MDNRLITTDRETASTAAPPQPGRLRRIVTPGRIAALLIVAFWAVMMGQLYRREVRHAKVAPLAPAYDRILPPGVDRIERTMGIYMLQQRFGSARTVIERLQDSVRIDNEIRIDGSRIPKYVRPFDADVEISFLAELTPLTGLRTIQVKAPAFAVSVVGRVVDNQIILRGHIGDQPIEQVLPFAQQSLFSDLLSPLQGLPALGRSDVGRRWTLTLMNPVTGRPESVAVTVRERMQVVVGGKPTDVYVLEFKTRGSLWNTWVAADGEVLQQGTPFGLVLKREDIPFLGKTESLEHGQLPD